MNGILLGQLLPVLFVFTDVIRVLHDLLISFTVVWRIGEWIVAKLAEHWCYLIHLWEDIAWDLANPLGKGLQIDWLDDLVRRALNLGQWDLFAFKKNIFQLIRTLIVFKNRLRFWDILSIKPNPTIFKYLKS